MSDNIKKYIYLDHSASTPIEPEILDLMKSCSLDYYQNPSSIHSGGRKAKQIITESKIKISAILDVNPDEIIFTGSGTESDNLAVLGVARANKKHGKHIIISSIEHKAVIESARQLESEGFEITTIPIDKNGIVDVAKCIKSIRPDTLLISVIHANNEIGTVQPIQKLSKEIQKIRGENSFPLFHTDACQSIGLLPISAENLGVDLMTMNSSKAYGPKGIGLLYKKTGIELQPLIFGGSQEFGLRAGTQSVALIVGFVRAIEIAEQKRTGETERLKKLQTYFINEILEKIPGAILNGHRSKRLANNVHISIPYVEGESIILCLEQYGVAIATGSACSSFDLEPSHVLRAIEQNDLLIHGSLRFSFGRGTVLADLDYTIKKLTQIIKKLSSLSALTTYAYETHKK
ncbi:MAG: cysteine desulfurase [Candidatus Nomurabacteria bacterium]|nr:cysteine desulfurase [Candidatus Nomurabacteria bacterium]